MRRPLRGTCLRCCCDTDALFRSRGGHMPKFRLLVVALALSSPLAAQTRSIVSSADLDAALAAKPIDQRQIVQQFLDRADTREAVAKLGVSPTTLSAKVA